ncbi:MAG: plasmid maintenance system antidote protein [Citrobacter freundii]|nr:MAG: plasmid maintenance system antidote protein [Citrobacter freundii]
MPSNLEKYKGIHPGKVLEQELKKRKISQRPFAQSIDEHPQSLNAILKGKRGMNTALSLKIEKQLALEEGTLMTLQVFYDIKVEKQKQGESDHPSYAVIRRILFWDTTLQQIDWQNQHAYVIERVFERGNEDEKKEIVRFYGKDRVKSIIGTSRISYQKPLTIGKSEKNK